MESLSSVSPFSSAVVAAPTEALLAFFFFFFFFFLLGVVDFVVVESSSFRRRCCSRKWFRIICTKKNLGDSGPRLADPVPAAASAPASVPLLVTSFSIPHSSCVYSSSKWQHGKSQL